MSGLGLGPAIGNLVAVVDGRVRLFLYHKSRFGVASKSQPIHGTIECRGFKVCSKKNQQKNTIFFVVLKFY